MPRLFLGLVLCCCSRLLAQPGIGQNGVVNRASQIPPTLAGGAIARGAAFTIHGVRFGSSPKISLRQGNAQIAVRVLSAEPEKIEAVMPKTAPLGAASLVIEAGGIASKPFPLTVASSNPGIFSQNHHGWGPGQITANPAHPGQRVSMRITGLGTSTAAVVVGNRRAQAVLTRTFPSGEQEVAFTIPPDAPQGCYVPVYLEAAPARASNVVTLAIRPGAGACDSGPLPSLDAARIGLVVLTRASILKNGKDSTMDEVIATFTAKNGGPALSPLLLIPPPGACTAYTSSFQASTIRPDSITAALVADLGGDGLAAGPELDLARADDRRIVPWDRGAAGYYRAGLSPPFLSPGEFSLSAPGGMDVAAFRMLLAGPAPFSWTDRAQIETVDRSRGVTLHWEKQAAHWTLLLATNVDQLTTAFGTTLCTAPLGADRFEIPPALLANIPASIDIPGIPYDQLFVASVPAKAAQIRAAGLGAGAALTLYASGRVVRYR